MAFAEANASLTKARIEARDENDKKLAALDKQAADIKPKLVRKLSQAGSTTIVNDLTAKSLAVRTSIDSLSTATADSLDAVKSTIKARLDAYEDAIDEAKKGL